MAKKIHPVQKFLLLFYALLAVVVIGLILIIWYPLSGIKIDDFSPIKNATLIHSTDYVFEITDIKDYSYYKYTISLVNKTTGSKMAIGNITDFDLKEEEYQYLLLDYNNNNYLIVTHYGGGATQGGDIYKVYKLADVPEYITSTHEGGYGTDLSCVRLRQRGNKLVYNAWFHCEPLTFPFEYLSSKVDSYYLELE